ncbi:MAG: sulfatase-like hydrolase/transferase, partial [Candidatus Sulfotelmatobacter sp.]
MGIFLPQIGTARERLSGATSFAPARGKLSWLSVAYAFFFCSARLALGGFLLLTSVYCLLVSVPFSYFGFIRNPLLSWIPLFVRLHGLIYGILLGGVAITLIPDMRRRETRRAAVGFLALNGSVFLYIWREGALAGLQPDLSACLWSMLSLFPLLWLAALDLSAEKNWLFEENGDNLGLAKTTLAAVSVSVVFAATSALRGSHLPGSLALQGLCASLCFHLAIFTGIGFILGFIRWLSRATPRPRIIHPVLTRVFIWLVLARLLRTMILPTISFEGLQADIFAGVVPLVVVLFATGFAVRLRALAPNEGPPIGTVMKLAWPWIIGAAGLVASAYAIPVLLERTDWDFVLQRIAVIAVWFFVLQMVRCTGIRIRGKAMSIALLLLLSGAAAGFVSYAKLTLYNPDPSPKWLGMFESYAGADISFKTAQDVLSRPVDNKAYRQFYEFLKKNTNLGLDASVGPVDTRLVPDLHPTPGVKPNIFLFVIDSLRQDYVSPYNPSAAEYMPEIDRFARDSVVMQNAYTRYGGTALSEPAIWVGAMQLHKQYIQPFYPMNNLQKLLDAGGYQSYISVDPILRRMLEPSSSITELDRDTKLWSDLDFIPTLKELEAKIDARSDQKKPIFAYSQPQNVHTLTLERSKIKGGRKAVSIYELRRIDAAFGEFVDFLKQRGLYENSIIILTADHGDSYGEFGRYGHSAYLFTEVIRIPLIIHLPPRMRSEFV